MGDWGVKVAKEGYGVGTATDNHLIFNSKYPALKIMDSGSGSVELSGGQAHVHLGTYELDYKPFFFVATEYVNEGTSVVREMRQCTFRDYFGLGVSSKYAAYSGTAYVTLDINSERGGVGGTCGLNYIWAVYYDPIK